MFYHTFTPQLRIFRPPICAVHIRSKSCNIAALKRIGRYLKDTLEKWLFLCPKQGLNIDCYPDEDFSGLRGHKDPMDPHCASSCTGYIICLIG